MSKERTYGALGRTLREIEACPATALEIDMAVHLRELLAENAALKEDAERREDYAFNKEIPNGLGLVHDIWAAAQSTGPSDSPSKAFERINALLGLSHG